MAVEGHKSAAGLMFLHNISRFVALCFVSAKAAVHRRKNLDRLWTAALPTEPGQHPQRGELLLAAWHYVLLAFT